MAGVRSTGSAADACHPAVARRDRRDLGPPRALHGPGSGEAAATAVEIAKREAGRGEPSPTGLRRSCPIFKGPGRLGRCSPGSGGAAPSSRGRGGWGGVRLAPAELPRFREAGEVGAVLAWLRRSCPVFERPGRLGRCSPGSGGAVQSSRGRGGWGGAHLAPTELPNPREAGEVGAVLAWLLRSCPNLERPERLGRCSPGSGGAAHSSRGRGAWGGARLAPAKLLGGQRAAVVAPAGRHEDVAQLGPSAPGRASRPARSPRTRGRRASRGCATGCWR